MTKRIFIILLLYFVNLDFANASGSCQSAYKTAFSDCDKANIKDPLLLIKQVEEAAKSSETGTVPALELSIANGETARRQLDEFEKKCYSSYKNCEKVCQQEAQAQSNAMNEAAAQEAQQAGKQCTQEPAQNHAAAKGAGMNLGQILPQLLAALTALTGQKGAGGDACTSNPENCRLDTASTNPGSTLTDNTSTSDGGMLDTAPITNDVIAQGEAAAPERAQFAASAGGGGGMGMPGGFGGPGRAKGIPEVNGDTSPKINLNPQSGGGGGKGGGFTGMQASSFSKSSGNPIASRVGIDADSRAGMNSAADKALQARGLAGEGGQAGGITAAHAFDNFQKVEKRIQSERNKLAELN